MCDYQIFCSECGCELGIDEGHHMADRAFCGDCLDDLTVCCFECGTRMFREESVGGDHDRPVCERCYDDYFTNCAECGRMIYQENAYYDEYDRTLCNRCQKDALINNYSYKPDPIFYGNENELFLGVELELDEGGCSRRNAKELLDIANFHDRYIYIKNDGSLDEGFEVVTHPMTLKFHMEEMPWEDMMHEALRLGYRSHQTGTCGLHCHVNRTFFGQTQEQQDRNIGKVLFLVEKYWDELLRFSRRTEGQMNHWVCRYGFKEKPEQVMDFAKKSGWGRYTCINLQNYNTIEFRMWRGTLKYNTLIATLQMVERLCKVALFNSEEELQNLSWWRFVSMVKEQELIKYLKEHQLYINEPIESEEEM